MNISLSLLTIILGLACVALHFYGVVNPGKYGLALRKFPRSEFWGYLLMGVSTAWFLYNVKIEPIADFAKFKNAMFAVFAVIGIGTCIYVRDFLAARGLAVFMMLLAKLMVDTARWADSNWRWVIAGWAYAMVVAGIWITISPYRLRDFIEWVTRSEFRTRLHSGLRVAFGVFVAALGLLVFRKP